MKYIYNLPRWILGLIYFVFGLNGFFHFIPFDPKDMPASALAFSGAMMVTGYFFPVLKVTEIFGGALLLAGRAVPFSIILLAPITVQIFLFHYFLTPGDLLMALVMMAIHLYLGFQYWKSFKPLFK